MSMSYISDRVTVSNWRTSRLKFTGAFWTVCVLVLSSATSLNCSKYLENLPVSQLQSLTSNQLKDVLMLNKLLCFFFKVCCYLLQASFFDMGKDDE